MAGVRLESFEYCVRAWPGLGPVAGRDVIRFIAGTGAENHRHKRGLARRHPDVRSGCDTRAGCQVRQGVAWPVGPQDIAREDTSGACALLRPCVAGPDPVSALLPVRAALRARPRHEEPHKRRQDGAAGFPLARPYRRRQDGRGGRRLTQSHQGRADRRGRVAMGQSHCGGPHGRARLALGQRHAQLAIFRICRAHAPKGDCLLPGDPARAPGALALGQPAAVIASILANRK